MENLKIPKPYHAGIKKIHNLSVSEMSELLTILTAEQPVLGSKNLISSLKSKVKSLDAEAVEEIANTLLALHSFRSFLDKPVANFVQSIGDSDNFKELDIPEEDHNKVRERLVQLLSAQPLVIASKALNVMMAHEHVLDNARILTDIRPVYEDDLVSTVEGQPAAAVIVQMLSLRYQDAGELKEFFIALDTEDVRKLQQVLERANAKANSLKIMLKNSGVPYLEVEEESR